MKTRGFLSAFKFRVGFCIYIALAITGGGLAVLAIINGEWAWAIWFSMVSLFSLDLLTDFTNIRRAHHD